MLSFSYDKVFGSFELYTFFFYGKLPKGAAVDFS